MGIINLYKRKRTGQKTHKFAAKRKVKRAAKKERKQSKEAGKQEKRRREFERWWERELRKRRVDSWNLDHSRIRGNRECEANEQVAEVFGTFDLDLRHPSFVGFAGRVEFLIRIVEELSFEIVEKEQGVLEELQSVVVRARLSSRQSQDTRQEEVTESSSTDFPRPILLSTPPTSKLLDIPIEKKGKWAERLNLLIDTVHGRHANDVSSTQATQDSSPKLKIDSPFQQTLPPCLVPLPPSRPSSALSAGCISSRPPSQESSVHRA